MFFQAEVHKEKKKDQNPAQGINDAVKHDRYGRSPNK